MMTDGKNILGFGTTQTIEYFGCLLTSMSMIVNHFGDNVTPASLNDRMKSVGGFNGPWIKAAQVPGIYAQLGFKRQHYYNHKTDGTPAPLDKIDAGLEAGSLIVVMVDWQPDPDIDGHWVVLHKKQGDDYLMWDPWRK